MDYEDWTKELDSEDNAHKEYRERAQKVVDRYEDEEDKKETKFNILWSNTEVLHSTLYARTPNPDIRRRFSDKDPNGKKAAQIAERAISHCIDTYDFDGMVGAVLTDYLVPGMGQVRLRYKPYFEMGEKPRVDLDVREDGFDENMIMNYAAYNGEDRVEEYEVENGMPWMWGDPEEELVYEEIDVEPVNWKRFRYQPCARWEDADWACIEHYPTKDELDEMYDEKTVRLIPLGYTDKGDKAETDDDKKRARIYEIFDKKNRKNIEMAEGYDEILKEEDDPLNLEGYYPFPKPLLATLKNGKFVPIPDYLFYQDQAMELDKVSSRIECLTEQLKVRGVYDASFETLSQVESATDGEYIPVDDFASRFNGSQGDLNKVIATMPIEEIQTVLVGLHKSREEIKQTIYEITGIADIMRGATKASETLGAQQIKTQFGSMRVAKRQRRVAQFIRDIIRIKVEMIVENFQPETIEQMTGMELTPEVYEILTNDMMRSYRIDIETDSTIADDAVEEKKQRIELVTAVTTFVEKVGPMVQMGLMPANVAKELLGFAVRAFKIGRSLEEVLDEMGGEEGDPREAEMKQQVQQFQQQLEQKSQEQVQQVVEEAQKRIQQSEKQAFDAQKALAINKAVSAADVQKAQIEGRIETTINDNKNASDAQLTMFKAQLDAILKIPDERNGSFEQLVSAIDEAMTNQQAESQKTIEDLNKKVDETQANLTNVVEFMKRPAKIVRDEKGKVTGAVRE